LRVLVADDNRDAADTLAGLLMLCGAAVRACYDGTEGARVAAEYRPDVGLFDVNMPGMGGCDLARQVRQEAGRRPVLLVAITGISDHEAMRRTVAAGFNIHLTKPADPAAPIRTLSEFDPWLQSRPATGSKA
jgi:CheY-like chemotaxis protein